MLPPPERHCSVVPSLNDPPPNDLLLFGGGYLNGRPLDSGSKRVNCCAPASRVLARGCVSARPERSFWGRAVRGGARDVRLGAPDELFSRGAALSSAVLGGAGRGWRAAALFPFIGNREAARPTAPPPPRSRARRSGLSWPPLARRAHPPAARLLLWPLGGVRSPRAASVTPRPGIPFMPLTRSPGWAAAGGARPAQPRRPPLGWGCGRDAERAGDPPPPGEAGRKLPSAQATRAAVPQPLRRLALACSSARSSRSGPRHPSSGLTPRRTGLGLQPWTGGFARDVEGCLQRRAAGQCLETL